MHKFGNRTTINVICHLSHFKTSWNPHWRLTKSSPEAATNKASSATFSNSSRFRSAWLLCMVNCGRKRCLAGHNHHWIQNLVSKTMVVGIFQHPTSQSVLASQCMYAVGSPQTVTCTCGKNNLYTNGIPWALTLQGMEFIAILKGLLGGIKLGSDRQTCQTYHLCEAFHI